MKSIYPLRSSTDIHVTRKLRPIIAAQESSHSSRYLEDNCPDACHGDRRNGFALNDNQTILIEGDRITAGASGSIRIPANANIIDASGKTVILV